MTATNATAAATADAAQPEQDLGPLAWVIEEVRKCVDTSAKALQRHLREAESAAGSDLSTVDVAGLRQARTAYHQAGGALELVGVGPSVKLIRGMELSVQRWLQRPEHCNAKAVETVERAGFALMEFLDTRLAGKPVNAVALFPQYQDVQQLHSTDKVQPSDLFAPPRVAARLGKDMLVGGPLLPEPAVRATLDSAVLRLLKGDLSAARTLDATCQGLALGARAAADRRLWALAAGFFQARALRLLPEDVYVKRVPSRVLQHFGALTKGDQSQGESLTHELLFQCAQAAPQGEAQQTALAAQAPLLAALRSGLALESMPSANYADRRFGRFDPTVLQQARKRIATVAETWSALAGGDLNKQRVVLDQFNLVADSLKRLRPGNENLPAALLRAVDVAAKGSAAPNTALAMEVATAVLYLQAVFEDLDPDDARWSERASRLSERLDRVAAGGAPEALEGWIEELYRRVSDRQTMGSVVDELRVALGEVEKSLDQFFRNPADVAPLAGVSGQLSQMRGVLSVLGLDQASLAVLRMREQVDRFQLGEPASDAQRQPLIERMGNTLGALGFMIDMLSYQRAMARKLFIYDEDAGELRLLMGRAAPPSDKAQVPTLTATVDAGGTAAASGADHGLGIDLDLVSVQAPLRAAPADSAAAPDVPLLEPMAFAHGSDPAELPALQPPSAESLAVQEVDFSQFEASLSGSLQALTEAELPQAPLAAVRPVPSLVEAVPELEGISLDLGPIDGAPAAEASTGSAIEPAAAQADGESLEALELQFSESVARAFEDEAPTVESASSFTSAPPSAVPAAPPAAPVAASAAAVPATTPPAPSAAVDAAAPDDELLGIFLDEAREVVEQGAQAIALLRQNPQSLAEQTQLRRVFHTLKGSSRMVGLNAFGEAAWAFEQLHNAHLAEQQAANPAILRLSEDALNGFGRWVTDLAAQKGVAPQWSAEPFRRSADAWRVDGTWLGLDGSADGSPAPADQGLAPEPPVQQVAPPAASPPASAATFTLDERDDNDHTDFQATIAFIDESDPFGAPPAPPADLGIGEMDFADIGRPKAAPNAAATPDQPGPESTEAPAAAEEESTKVIDGLRISIPLYNVYLNEADEWSRRLQVGADEWAHEPVTPLPSPMAAMAHSLAGSSATVGFVGLSDLARMLENTIEHLDMFPRVADAHVAAVQDAAADVRRLLHQFAAGFLKVPRPEVLQALQAVLDEAPAAFVDEPSAYRDSVPFESRSHSVPGFSRSDFAHNDFERSQMPDDPLASDLGGLGRGSGRKVEVSSFAPLQASRSVNLQIDLDDDGSVQDTLDLDLFPIFDEEATELMPVLGAALRRWCHNPGDMPARASVLRSLHTLKGSARLAGALWLGERTHRVESAIETLGSDALADGQVRSVELEPLLSAYDVLTDHLSELREALAQAESPMDAAAPAAAAQPEPLDVDVSVHTADAPPAVAALAPPEVVPLDAVPVEPVAPVIEPVTSPEGAIENIAYSADKLPELADFTSKAPGAAPAPTEPAAATDLTAATQVTPGQDAAPGAAAATISVPAVPVASVASVAPAAPAAVAVAATLAAPVTAALAVPPPAPAAAAARAPVVASRAVSAASTATVLNPLKASAAQAVRVRPQLLDRLLNQAGEVMMSRSRLDTRLGQIRSSLSDLDGNLERLRTQLREIAVQAESQMQSRLALSKEAAVDFDPLEFDRFTRVQELTRIMAESVNDVATVQRNLQRDVQGAEDDLGAQARQARELQRDLLRTRMLEFDSVAERLYAVVRQAAREAGKVVRLDLSGGHIEIDRGVLDRMGPVFEHLLRNSIVHGIETAEARTAAGKPIAGLIRISLAQEGNDVAIEVSDDGAGLNLPRITDKARAQGLLAADAELTEHDAAQLIFMPGFTTAAKVSELAGRGIGMDVVRAEVTALGGRIETRTQAGQGTQFRLVLPLTTAVTQVVLLRLGSWVWGIPASLVERVRRTPLRVARQAQVDGQVAPALLGENAEADAPAVPFWWAGALLQHSALSAEPPSRTVPVLVIRSAAQRVALWADEVLGNQEVVVKNLGPQLSRLPGLTGLTILPTGATVLLYNPVALASVYAAQANEVNQAAVEPLQHLMEHTPSGFGPSSQMHDSRLSELSSVEGGEADALQALQTAAARRVAQRTLVPVVAAPEIDRSLPLVLVVDDSITVRRVTQRLLVREGYRVALAADGLQAIERLREERPAVVLTDIEMPRMDGFDLTRNIRGEPNWAELPVVMITSRIAPKHREQAVSLGVKHYLGKPYSEDELLRIVADYVAQASQPAAHA